MKRLVAGFIASVVSFGLLASEASAARYIATYTGVVNRGYDYGQVFGDVLRLDGESFTATYLFDSDVGIDHYLTPTSQWRLGGTNSGADTPILKASITIKGTTVQFDSSWESSLSYDAGDAASHGVNGQPDGATYLFNMLRGAPFSRITDVGTYSSDDGFGGFGLAKNGTWTSAGLVSQTLTLSAIPEPASWAMMIVGFGAAGAMVRSSRRRGCVVAP